MGTAQQVNSSYSRIQPFVEIMDSTLRDGEQTSGVSFLPHEKLVIARKLLKDVNVDRIEVASARVSEGEKEAVSMICRYARQIDLLERVEVLGFVDGRLSVDWIDSCGGKVINLLAKGSLRHCAGQLHKTPREHIDDIRGTIAYAFDKGFAFMLPDAEEGRIEAEKAKLEAEVNAGKFKAEAAIEFEKLLSANEFMQSSLYEAIKFANLNDEQFRAKALQRLWDIASNYGFDYKTVTISQLVKSGAGAELKSIWREAVSSYKASAQKEDLDKRQTELERLRRLGEDKAFAQWDQEQAELSLLSPLLVAKPSSDNLAELLALYQKNVTISPSTGFHPPLKGDISPLTAVTIHELVHYMC